MTRPSPRAVVLALALAAAASLALAGTFPVHNNDTFGHLAQGRQIAELGRVPSVDTLSFFEETPQPWHNYEWGSDIVFWLAYDNGGANCLLGLKLLLLALTGFFLVRRAADASARPALAAALTVVLLVWAIPAARFRLTARPEVFGYALGALFLVGLGRMVGLGSGGRSADAASKRALWRWVVGLGLAHLAWVNLHGSHLLGVALVGTHLAVSVRERDTAKALGALLGLQLVASCISPYGPAIVTDAITHVFDPVYREIVREWAPWSEKDPPFYLAALAVESVLLVVVARPLLRGGTRARAALLTAVLLAVMGLRSLRFVATYVLLAAPLLAEGAALLLADRLESRAKAVGLVLAALTIALVVAVVETPGLPPEVAMGGGERHDTLPRESGRFLRDRVPDARVVAPMEVSWYLMFADPTARFLIDGRVPFYGAEHVQRVGMAFDDPARFVAVLGAYRVDAVVLDFGSSARQTSVATMMAHPDFGPVVLEDDYVTYVHATPGRARLLETHRYRAIAPRFDPALVLAPDAELEAIRAELSRLERQEGARAFSGWLRGLLALRTLARDGVDAGFFAPRDDDERARASRASRDLERAGRHYPLVPIVQSYRALAAVEACRADEAREALALAAIEGGNREALLAAMELDLRTGDRAKVRALLAEAAGDAEANADPSIGALRLDLSDDVTCR